MQLDETKKALEAFAQKIIRYAKDNLKGKSASGKLSKSLRPNIKVSKNSVEFDIFAENYADFVDKGVSGKKKKYNTPYSYKDKKPPASAFDKWIIKRGIAPRDKNGRFQDRKSLQFAMSNHVFNKGIKPSLFITKAYRKAMKEFDNDVIQKYGLDTDRVITDILKDL
jgi:hypothetical protein